MRERGCVCEVRVRAKEEEWNEKIGFDEIKMGCGALISQYCCATSTMHVVHNDQGEELVRSIEYKTC